MKLERKELAQLGGVLGLALLLARLHSVHFTGTA